MGREGGETRLELAWPFRGKQGHGRERRLHSLAEEARLFLSIFDVIFLSVAVRGGG